MVDIPGLGLRVAPGFRVTLYSDQDLASDIYAMTLDARGRVVVTSQGYIKTLLDIDGDGRADQAALFATTQTGGMGLCFDGNDLYFAGDGSLSCYRDRDGNGAADGPPEKLLPLNFAEHGGHAMRKGPDGWWYLIGGNDTVFSAAKHVTLPNCVICEPEAGALLRIAPDGKSSEVFAHGLRNPYDFDFNWAGDLFTYDSDVESDLFLPWYTPTRLYHIAQGGHHGWRLNGWTRSWNRPGYYLDTVDILTLVGRGSPTGVVNYRHYQFPEYFRNGLFVCDWTFGRVYFFALAPDGATYRTQPELFIEPIGTHGFAPTDVAVAPDGSLFISSGGRKTRGAVYRVEHIAGAASAESINPSGIRLLPVSSDLEAVLRMPQPLDAWSRAYWAPLAQRLGAASFSQAALNRTLDPTLRVRAIEVLTELFKGLPLAVARTVAVDPSPQVRARVAWSLGRTPCENFGSVLVPMAQDRTPLVRRSALEAVADRASQLSATNLVRALQANLGQPDKRVRQAAARLAALLPETVWIAFGSELERAPAQARLTGALAGEWRNSADNIHTNTIGTVLSVLKTSRDNELRLQAVRLLMLALGDYHLHEPSVEVYTAYELARSLEEHDAIKADILASIRPLVPSGNWRLDGEALRLSAMLEDPDTNLVRKVTGLISTATTATSDFHYLTILSRLRGSRAPDLTARIAHAVLSLDRKLQGLQERGKQNWGLRLNETLTHLIRRDPQLVEALLKHPDFARPNHVGLVSCLGPHFRQRAAGLYLLAAQRNPGFTWSGPLIDLLASVQTDEVKFMFRQHWSNFALRDDLLFKLAAKPEPIDREKFVIGLESTRPQIIRASLAALQVLPGDESPTNLVPVMRLLRRLLSEPKEAGLRTQTLALLAKQSKQSFRVVETSIETAGLKRAYQPVFDWFRQTFPNLIQVLDSEGGEDPIKWDRALRGVAWNAGDAARGEAIFRDRGCQTCHAGANALGPDLAGVAGRFSAEDLFLAIVFPSRDIAPPYRATVFQTRDGQTVTGMVAFESADGVIVQTGAAATLRLGEADIVSRAPSNLSLMPAGLLNNLRPQELADLYSYLKSLRPQGR